MFLTWIFMPKLCKRFLSKTELNLIAKFIAVFMISFDIGDDFIRLYFGTWDYKTDLPIHLCGFSIYLGAIMLLNKN